jgi:hypothetical protein
VEDEEMVMLCYTVGSSNETTREVGGEKIWIVRKRQKEMWTTMMCAEKVEAVTSIQDSL